MDTARREHKNDININITLTVTNAGLQIFDIIGISNIDWSTMLRKGGVTGLYLGLVVEKANCSPQWFSLAFVDKSDIILTA
jgi:hypothetical protein